MYGLSIFSEVKGDLNLMSVIINDERMDKVVKKYINITDETFTEIAGEPVDVSKYFYGDTKFIYYKHREEWYKVTYFKVIVLSRLLRLTLEESILISFGMLKGVNGECDLEIKDVIEKLGEKESDIFIDASEKAMNSFYKYFHNVESLLHNEYVYNSVDEEDRIIRLLDKLNKLIKNYMSFVRFHDVYHDFLPVDSDVSVGTCAERVLEDSRFYKSVEDERLKENIKSFVEMSYLINRDTVLNNVGVTIYDGYLKGCKELGLDMDVVIKVTNNLYVRRGSEGYGTVECSSKSSYRLDKERIKYFLNLYDKKFNSNKLTKKQLLNNMILNEDKDRVRDLFCVQLNKSEFNVSSDTSKIINNLLIFKENKYSGLKELQGIILGAISKEFGLSDFRMSDNYIVIEDLKDLSSKNVSYKYNVRAKEMIINIKEDTLGNLVRGCVRRDTEGLSARTIYEGIVMGCYKDFKKTPSKQELSNYVRILNKYNSLYKVNIDDALLKEGVNSSVYRYRVDSVGRDEFRLSGDISKLYSRLDETCSEFDFIKYEDKVVEIVTKSCRLLEKIVKFNLSQDDKTLLYGLKQSLNIGNEYEYKLSITEEYKKYGVDYGSESFNVTKMYDDIARISYNIYEKDLDKKLSEKVLGLFRFTKEDNKLYKEEFLASFKDSHDSFITYKTLSKEFKDTRILRRNIRDIYIIKILEGGLHNELSYILSVLNEKGFKDSKKMSLINYIYGDCVDRQCMRDIDALHTYRDYLTMYVALSNKGMRDMEDFKLEPYALKLEHDIIMREYYVLKDEIDEQKFKNAYKDEDILKLTRLKLDEGLGRGKNRVVKLVIPSDSNDVRDEGKNLNHCVGSYVSSIIKGSKLIYFLRVAEDVGESYCTVEIIKGENYYKLGQVKMCSNMSYNNTKVKDKIRDRIGEVNKDKRKELLSEG